MYNFILNTRRMTFSALVIAIYIAVLYVTPVSYTHLTLPTKA